MPHQTDIEDLKKDPIGRIAYQPAREEIVEDLVETSPPTPLSGVRGPG